MLTDTKLRNLKPGIKACKVADRDGLYVSVLPTGAVSFRYNYRLNGRQQTVFFGRYGVGGLSLQKARELLDMSKKLVAEGKSPAMQKARTHRQQQQAEPFGIWVERWLLKH